MLHTNRGELQLLMNTYCRIWEAGGQATLTTSTEGGELKAKLEIQLGSPAAPRPGAPSATSGHPAAAHRPCHRGPAAKARSRARAAAYQATKAVAAATASLSPPLLWPLDQEELLLPLLLFSDDHCIFCLHHQLVVEG